MNSDMWQKLLENWEYAKTSRKLENIIGINRKTWRWPRMKSEMWLKILENWDIAKTCKNHRKTIGNSWEILGNNLENNRKTNGKNIGHIRKHRRLFLSTKIFLFLEVIRFFSYCLLICKFPGRACNSSIIIRELPETKPLFVALSSLSWFVTMTCLALTTFACRSLQNHSNTLNIIKHDFAIQSYLSSGCFTVVLRRAMSVGSWGRCHSEVVSVALCLDGECLVAIGYR